MSSHNAEISEAEKKSASVEDSVSRHVGVETMGADHSPVAVDHTVTESCNSDSSSPSKSSCATIDLPKIAVGDSQSGLTDSVSDLPTNESPCPDKEKKSYNVAEMCAVSSVASATPSLATNEASTEIKRVDKESPQNPSVVASDLSQGSHSEAPSLSHPEGNTSVSVKSTLSHVKGEGAAGGEPDIHGSGDNASGYFPKLDGTNVTTKSTGENKQNVESEVPTEKEKNSVEMKTKGKEEQCKDVTKPDTSVTATAENDDEKQSIYHVKWIKHNGALMPIITQNENGPCPLLAIMNLLLLQSKIKFLAGTEVVTSNELMAHLADWIFEHVPKNISEDTRLNYEQNMHDAIAVFPKLQTGLDVNVRFTGVSQFEYTPECIVFDLLDVPLYHGWLVDPQVPDLVSAIGNRTYNQLVEKIILQKNSNKEELVAEALLAEEFLNVTASQLTYHGLSELSATIKEEEMCVLFRNNHFSTLYKHKNELFVLVTDQGFLRESNVVWETLSNIEGDGHFVDADFRTYRLPEAAAASAAAPSLPPPSFPVNSKEQIDHDYLVALSLEQEQSEMQPGQQWSDSATISDHELALRLQEEENMNAESAARQQPEKATPSASNTGSVANSGSAGNVTKEKKESSCSLM